ncbi:hypothetical protein [Cupriavidus sp. YAF13]|uniref:hypothetical protein n=1 Tax=Cupriavidus sp. YAF13 TaxID=3233075 RepID=UPI003F8EB090
MDQSNVINEFGGAGRAEHPQEVRLGCATVGVPLFNRIRRGLRSVVNWIEPDAGL